MMLEDFFHRQLESWPLAAKNFEALRGVVTRTIMLDGFPIRLQHNPGRIASATAKTGKEEVKQRPCFLCKSNRPEEQGTIPFHASREYEILVNPFPIAPRHFTIAAVEHINQDCFQPQDMEMFVNLYPDFVAFYNGSTAGASAPDHLHFQACNKDFIAPLISLAENEKGELIKQTPDCRIYSFPSMPVSIIHFESQSLSDEISAWLENLVPESPESLKPAIGNRNIFIWKDAAGSLHTLLFPRATHRPACFYAAGEENMLVSPGALDMAGVVILPRREDYDAMTPVMLRKIFDEVSCDFRSLPSFSRLLML